MSAIGFRRIRVHIELEQHRFDTEIIFVEQLVLPYGLLGRRTIFSQFNEVVFSREGVPTEGGASLVRGSRR